MNFGIVHCSQAFPDRRRHFQHQFISSFCLSTLIPARLASSRPAPPSIATQSCITSYVYRSRAFVSARLRHQGHSSGRRLRESGKYLRVIGLLNLEYCESRHDCTRCSIRGAFRSSQGNRVKQRSKAFGDFTNCSIGGTGIACQGTRVESKLKAF